MTPTRNVFKHQLMYSYATAMYTSFVLNTYFIHGSLEYSASIQNTQPKYLLFSVPLFSYNFRLVLSCTREGAARVSHDHAQRHRLTNTQHKGNNNPENMKMSNTCMKPQEGGFRRPSWAKCRDGPGCRTGNSANMQHLVVPTLKPLGQAAGQKERHTLNMH